MSGAIPGLVVLGCRRKQAEQAIGNEAASNTPLRSLYHISSCPQVPALFEFSVLTPLVMNSNLLWPLPARTQLLCETDSILLLNTSHRCELLVSSELFISHTMVSVLKKNYDSIFLQDKVSDELVH